MFTEGSGAANCLIFKEVSHLHKLALSLESWEIRPRASFLARKPLPQQELIVFTLFSHFMLPSISLTLPRALFPSHCFPLRNRYIAWDTRMKMKAELISWKSVSLLIQDELLNSPRGRNTATDLGGVWGNWIDLQISAGSWTEQFSLCGLRRWRNSKAFQRAQCTWVYKTIYSGSLASIDKSELNITLYANILCFALAYRHLMYLNRAAQLLRYSPEEN